MKNKHDEISENIIEILINWGSIFVHVMYWPIKIKFKHVILNHWIKRLFRKKNRIFYGFLFFFYLWFINLYDTMDKYNFHCKMERFQWKITSYTVNYNGIYRNDNHMAIIDVTPRQINDVQCIISKSFWPTSPPPPPEKKKFLQHTHVTY